MALNLIGSFQQGQQARQFRRDARALEEERARLAAERTREETTRNRMRELLSGGLLTTPEGRREFLGEIGATTGDPGMVLDWQRHFAKQAPDVLAQRQAEAPFVVANLRGVADQASYEAALGRMGDLGIDVSDFPPTYDPRQMNMVLQSAQYLAEGPPKAAGGPFEGTGMQAQAANILLTGDPSSPEYRAAYAIASQPKTSFDVASGQMYTVTPDMSWARPPAGGARAVAAQAMEDKTEQPKPMSTPGAPGVSAKELPGAAQRLKPGEKARDTAFAKEFVTWEGGGRADAQKNLVQLEEQISRLAGGENVTGTVVGRLPGPVAELFTPSAVDVREQVEEVVQRNLRAVLGAQFTEREGERLISRAFNPRLDEATNVRRLQRLAASMRQAGEAKDAMAAYFNENGTLKGYTGPKLMTVGDIEASIEAIGAPSRPEGPEGLDFENMSLEELERLAR